VTHNCRSIKNVTPKSSTGGTSIW